jgi:hypothetical protein
VLTPTSVYSFRLANTTFVPSYTGAGSTASEFRIHKSAEAIRDFPRLRDVLRFRNILQLTGNDIGSVALTSLVGAPTKIAAVSTQDESIEALAEFARRRGIVDQISIHPNVGVDDIGRLTQIVEDEFGSGGLEVVLDDVSERLETGERAFAALFPRLAPGGSYLIERWSWDHFVLEGFLVAVGETGGEQARADEQRGAVQRVRAAKGEILEAILPKLVEAVRTRPDVVAAVTVGRHWMEVRRGPAPVDPSAFRLPRPAGP